MKMISNFAFVEVAKEEKKIKLKELESKLTASKRKIWSDIKEGLEEVKLIEKGEKQAKTAKEFLNEL
jgi:Fic family protein